MKQPTVAQYIKSERENGRFPSMPIDGAAGKFWLCDSDWRPLMGKHYDSRDAAMVARSRALQRRTNCASKAA